MARQLQIDLGLSGSNGLSVGVEVWQFNRRAGVAQPRESRILINYSRVIRAAGNSLAAAPLATTHFGRTALGGVIGRRRGGDVFDNEVEVGTDVVPNR